MHFVGSYYIYGRNEFDSRSCK